MKRINFLAFLILLLSTPVMAFEFGSGVPGTTSIKGGVEIATDAETVTGTSDAVVTTPGNITAKMAEPGTIGGTTPAAAFLTELELTGANIKYLLLTDSIDTEVNAATAGDTLVLAAGTYTITEDIDLTKSIYIIGQGEDATTITTTTDNINVFHITASNVGIVHLSIDVTASATHGIYASGVAGNVLTNVDLHCLTIDMNSHAGAQHAICYVDASGAIRNVELAATSSNGAASGIYAQNESTAEAATTVHAHSCHATVAGTSGLVIAYHVEDDSASENCTLNMFNSHGAATESGAISAGLSSHGGANGIAIGEHCVFGATDYDVYQATSGVVTLRNCVLVNNTTSGTIGSSGTVKTAGLSASGDITGATYSSDISDAELSTLDDCAVTELFVGGGAGSAPICTAATGTGAPVRAGSPTFTGTVGAAAISATGTITANAGDYTGTVSANLLTPDAADGADIGTADLEFSDVYLGASAVIYGELDQANSLTSSGTGWTANLNLGAATYTVADAGTIGSVSDPDAVAISSGGDVTLTQDIVMASGKLIGITGDLDLITLTADTFTVAGAMTATSFTADPVEDPFISLDALDAQDTDWWIGTNADAGATSNDNLEFRTNATAGINVFMSLTPTAAGEILRIGEDYDAMTVHLGLDDVEVSMELHDAATLTFHDASDDTTVVFGPVTNGTTILPITGSISATNFDGTVGANTPAAIAGTTLVTSAGVIVDYAGVDDAARTNTTLSTDHIVAWTALSTARNYQISSEDIAQAGRVFIVKDESGDAGTYALTVSTEGSEQIDGADTTTINANYGSVQLYSNGSHLFVF